MKRSAVQNGAPKPKREKVAPELREQKAAENSEALAEFLADKPDFELQEDGDGKPSIFVHSHQKILECNIGTVTSFYMGKKYQKTLAGGNQGCFFLTRKHFSKIGSTQG